MCGREKKHRPVITTLVTHRPLRSVGWMAGMSRPFKPLAAWRGRRRKKICAATTENHRRANHDLTTWIVPPAPLTWKDTRDLSSAMTTDNLIDLSYFWLKVVLFKNKKSVVPLPLFLSLLSRRAEHNEYILPFWCWVRTVAVFPHGCGRKDTFWERENRFGPPDYFPPLVATGRAPVDSRRKEKKE